MSTSPSLFEIFVDVDIDAPFALPFAIGAAMSTSPSVLFEIFVDVDIDAPALLQGQSSARIAKPACTGF